VDAAKTTAQKEALLAKLIKSGNETADLKQKFVVLEFARSTATGLSKIEETFRIVGQIEAQFDVDSIALRTKSLTELGKARVAPGERMIFVDRLAETAEQAIKADKFSSAIALLTLAQSTARSARSARELMIGRQIGGRLKEAEKLGTDFEALQTSFKLLTSKPDDADANLAIGRLRCFGQGLWIDGLPLIAKGNNQELAELAKLDIGTVNSVEQQVAVADRWWSLAENHEGLSRKEIRFRAGYWYEEARSRAKGLVAQKIESRLKELEPEKPVARTVDLLRLIDLRKHVVGGSWRVFRGTLLSSEESANRAVIPFNPPEEYDLQLVVERKTKVHHFALGVRAQGKLNLMLFDFLNSSKSALFSEPRVQFSRSVFTNGKRTKILVAVRKASLVVTADNREIIRWTGQTKLQQSRESDWRVPDGTNFFIGSSSSAFQIHSIELTPR
jgi:hypothetical protein